MTDAYHMDKLRYFDHEVTRAGHERFSSGYFESLEKHLGEREQMKDMPDDKHLATEPAPQQQPQPQAYAGPIVSAPPHREIPSFNGERAPLSPSQVRLSPEEVEVIRMNGWDMLKYAKSKQEHARRKRLGLDTSGQG